MYSNISQTLLLYKMWHYYNQSDSPKSLGVCYWCVKIPQCWFMDHGLKHVSFYVQKHVIAMGMCYNPALVGDKPLGSPASVKRVYWEKPPWRCGVVYINCLWKHKISKNINDTTTNDDDSDNDNDHDNIQDSNNNSVNDKSIRTGKRRRGINEILSYLYKCYLLTRHP